MSLRVDSLPKAFIWRRLHSLMGLWFVLFLIEHLLTNSQAALLLGENGQGFVRAVNFIHNLPYLQAIEIFLLGVPIAVHAILGIRYLFTAKFNSFPTDGSRPHLNYARNHAYTWQRITSWILLVLLCVHVVKFRFVEYPESVGEEPNVTYFVKVTRDPGLYSLSEKLGFNLYDEQHMHLKPGQIVAATSSFGTASLLTVRDTFKSPYWAALYTVFVLSACFHAFNGLWTFMLSWGWIIKVSAQRKGKRFCLGLMALITFFGLAAVWGTYFFNLRS